MPDIHFFPTAKLPFFFTLSFLIAAYCKNKQTKKPKKTPQRYGFVVHISRSVQKNAQRFYIPFTVTAQSIRSRRKTRAY